MKFTFLLLTNYRMICIIIAERVLIVKYLKVLLVLILVFLCGCGKTEPAAETTVTTVPETTEAVAGMLLEITDERPDKVLTETYKLQELRELLGDHDYILTFANTEEKLYLNEVHEAFPIECLKEDYAVYAVEEGGYYYVQWWARGALKAGEILDLSTAKVTECWYVPRVCVESDFDSIVMGVSTADDIRAIDPTVVVWSGGGCFSGAYDRGHDAYCHVLLENEEYFFIGFDKIDEKLIATEMEIVQGEFDTWNNDIRKRDWPVRTEEEDDTDWYQEFLDQTENPVDGTGMLPLIFVDTEKDAQVGYLICAGNDGQVYIADRFKYNGVSLYWEVNPEVHSVDYQKGPYSTEILDLSKDIVFRDFKGNSISSKVQELTGDYLTIIEFLQIRTHLDAPLPTESRLWFGTYEGIDMFPEDTVYTDEGIIVDLDGDGHEDRIKVELTQVPDSYTEDPFTGYTGYYYSYEYYVTRNGRTFRFKPFAEWVHVAPDDLAVFVADVDLDGEYEIIEFMYYSKRFGGVNVYDFNGATYDKLYYSISPQN